MNCKPFALLSLLLVPLPACAPDDGDAAVTVDDQEDAIIGGEDAKIQESPWQVALILDTGPQAGHLNCGGSIVDEYHVVTARHCFENSPENPTTLGSPKRMKVLAGVSKLSDQARGQLIEVDDAIPVVDGYDGDVGHGKDVLLLRLARPLHFNRKVQPIALVTHADERAGLIRPGTPARVTGWGRTSEEGEDSNVLLGLDVTLAAPEVLAEVEPDEDFVLGDLLATAGVEGEDTCPGDSGSGLVVRKGHGYALAGVVSFGFPPCGVGQPGGYARVSTFAAAIERTLCDEKKVIKSKDHIAGPTGEFQYITVDVPAGLRELNFNVFGGSGDVDMRVSRGTRPSEDVFDCKSATIDSNDETCNFAHPAPGRYYIGLLGFIDYADVKLRVNGYVRD